MKYTIVFDEYNSQITESETGFTFKQACKQIIEYCRESGNVVQEAVWELNLKEGKIQDTIIIV